MEGLSDGKEQEFMDHLASYTYISSDGYLDLENFACVLSSCFARDGNLHLSPQPRDVYLLLIAILDDIDDQYKSQRYVFYQPISPWISEYAHVYPEKYITKIHVAGLSLTWHDWIYEIGRTLMEVEPEDESPKYFYWAKPEWTFVYAFVSGFHRAFTKLLKDTDLNTIEKSGYSGFEALYRSTNEESDYDEIAARLKARRSVQKETMNDISVAAHAGYYLEAIALQECLMSNMLYNYMSGQGRNLKNPNLNRLISEVKNLTDKIDTDTIVLLDDIDGWRRRRNTAIHGAVTQKIEEYTSPGNWKKEDYLDTVEIGEKVIDRLFKWYDKCAVNFIPTEFDDVEKH